VFRISQVRPSTGIGNDVPGFAAGGKILLRVVDVPVDAKGGDQRSRLALLVTPVTGAQCFASCTNAVPTPPDAPMTSNSVSGFDTDLAQEMQRRGAAEPSASAQ